MPLALALAISALLHTAAIVAPGWDLPGMAEPEPPLDAHLTLPAKPVSQAAPAPKATPRPPKKSPPPAPAPTQSSVAPETTEAAAPATPPAPAAAEPVAEPVPPPVPPAPPWPSRGRVRYVVSYGDGGLILGETIHEWQVGDGHYSIRSAAAPKGVAALFGKTRTQTSVGEVTGAGLRPREFRDQREGRDVEVAAFDWSANQVAFSGGRGAARLAEGTQDLVSVFYQLAWLAPRRDVDLAVVTASRLGRWVFEWVGEENLDLPVGTLATLHLRTSASGDITEVWLAPAHGGLPVKIRHTDRKGEVFEQAADLLELN